MKRIKKISFLIFIFLPIFLISSTPVSHHDVRPVRDDVGFCWKANQITRLIEFLQANPKGAATPAEAPQGMICGISPHDDYLYAGRIYYPLFKNIKAKEVVIFGVTHGTVRKKIGDPQDKLIFDDYPYWRGPFQDIEVSPLREFLLKKLDSKVVLVNREAHNLEHSIEALLPFIQYYNRDVKITPIMVTGMSFQTMDKISSTLSALLTEYIEQKGLVLGKDIFFLISADANHYGHDFDNTVFGEDDQAHQMGTGSDKKVAGIFLANQITKEKLSDLTKKLWGDSYKEYGERLWCGKYCIPFGLLTVLKVVEKEQPAKKLKGKILVYSDTYSEGVLPLRKPGYGITAPFSLKHWVGFFSAAYYLE